MSKTMSRNEQTNRSADRRPFSMIVNQWMGRFRHVVRQRERPASVWTMNRDGHIVRQPLQQAAQWTDLDHSTCCM